MIRPPESHTDSATFR